jgi:hypothetical protein
MSKLLCLIAAFAAISSGQIPPPDNVTISDPRPLVKVVETLIARYGVRISYEDVSAYNFEADLVRSNPQTVLPRNSGLSISFGGLPQPKYDDTMKTQQSADPSKVKTLLQAILNQHERNGNPGRFKIVGTENGMAIVPTATRDSAGTFVPDQSILDQRISFPTMDTDNTDVALNAFCKALSTASGKNVYSRAGLSSTQVRIGADNEVARDVLARLFNSLRTNGMGLLQPGGRLNVGNPTTEVAWVLTTEPGVGYRLEARAIVIQYTWANSDHIWTVPIILPKQP